MNVIKIGEKENELKLKFILTKFNKMPRIDVFFGLPSYLEKILK